jgi:hypothetical protein
VAGKKKSALDGSRAFAGTRAAAIGAKRGKRTTWVKTKTKKKMRKGAGKTGARAANAATARTRRRAEERAALPTSARLGRMAGAAASLGLSDAVKKRSKKKAAKKRSVRLYRAAKKLDPTGRLSNRDVKMARKLTGSKKKR